MTKITWGRLKTELGVGEKLTGTVIRHEPYGVFVDIGYEYDGLIQITDFKDEGVMTPEEYPVIGSKISAVVLGFKDYGCQVWLGVKPSQLEGN
jgi:ribosomal protein S1